MLTSDWASSRITKAFTGAVPFNLHSSVVVMLDIMEGKRPPRPVHPTFTPELWELVQRCWDQESHSRPEISEVLRMLHDSSVFFFATTSVIHWPDHFIVYRDTPQKQNTLSTQPLIPASSSDPLQWIRHLENSSPNFPEQLASLLDGKAFRDSTQYLQGEHLAMLVDNLDRVCPHITPPYPLFTVILAPRYSRPRWPCLSQVSARTQKYMRYLGNTTEIIRNLRRSFEHQSPASRIWSFLRVRRNSQCFKGLRQTGTDLRE